MFSRDDVSRWWAQLRASGDVHRVLFFERHPELVEAGMRRDVVSRARFGDRLPSPAEVLEEAQLVALRESERPLRRSSPRGRAPGRALVGPTDEEFAAGAAEYAGECLLGFRRRSFAAWKAAHPDAWTDWCRRSGWSE